MTPANLCLSQNNTTAWRGHSCRSSQWDFFLGGCKVWAVKKLYKCQWNIFKQYERVLFFLFSFFRFSYHFHIELKHFGGDLVLQTHHPNNSHYCHLDFVRPLWCVLQPFNWKLRPGIVPKRLMPEVLRIRQCEPVTVIELHSRWNFHPVAVVVWKRWPEGSNRACIFLAPFGTTASKDRLVENQLISVALELRVAFYPRKLNEQ